jgi:OmpA-OmpF porin, OOP family
VYLNGIRVANAPKSPLGRSKTITITATASDDNPSLLGNIRVAEGGKKLYDAIAGTGRVATHGILFDTGSDRIRVESTPTLKEIAAMLTAHPDLKLDVEGHTDTVGDAAANQALSERRAEAVVAWLTGQGIAADRLTPKGYGATRPIASNATPEGRQINRRVELARPGAPPTASAADDGAAAAPSKATRPATKPAPRKTTKPAN